MVACTPLFSGVHGLHSDALVEAARGEDVVELIIARRLWILTGEIVGDDVAGVRGFANCRRLPLPLRSRSVLQRGSVEFA